jgi:hypothetical protein
MIERKIFIVLVILLNFCCKSDDYVDFNINAQEWKVITEELLKISEKNYLESDPLQTNSSMAMAYSFLYGW